MLIRMRSSTTSTCPEADFNSNALTGSLALGLNPAKVSAKLQPQLNMGFGGSARSVTWKSCGPVMVGTDTLLPAPDNRDGTTANGLMRYVPLTNPTYSLVNSQPGLQILYNNKWEGSVGPEGLIGATNGPTGQFAKNIRYGANNLVNYTQGNTISIGASIGFDKGSFDTTNVLSTSAPPGSIYVTPQGVSKTPNAAGIARNTLLGNLVWNGTINVGVPIGPPISYAGFCSDITAVGVGAAACWGENQTWNGDYFTKAINVKSGCLLGFEAGKNSCGPPTNATGNQARDARANPIAIGSQALWGSIVPKYNVIGGITQLEYVAWPGGENIAIGYKSNFLVGNFSIREQGKENLQKCADRTTTIGRNIFSTTPNDNSQELVLAGYRVGGPTGTTILGNDTSIRKWIQDWSFKAVAGQGPRGLKGDNCISIGPVVVPYIDPRIPADDYPYFGTKTCYIGNFEGIGNPENSVAIFRGFYGGDPNTVTLGSCESGGSIPHQIAFSKDDGFFVNSTTGAVTGDYACIFSQGPGKAAVAMRPALFFGGLKSGSFKIIENNVSKTYQVINGAIVSVT